tara:strand:+ start:11129 stop:11758 length:630 start_codon:yes stop_codon:yes gene_type:complete
MPDIKDSKLIVISAPSGTGKTTLVKLLLSNITKCKFSISHTTRKKRPNEINGKDYFFINPEEFKNLVKRDYFAEYAEVFGNWYGTSKKSIQLELDKGSWVILELDWQGATQIRASNLDCLSIFLLPPSKIHLKNRLYGRSTDSEDVIKRRLDEAVSDMKHWEEFDYVVINDDINKAYKQVKNILCGKGDENSSFNLINSSRISRIIESE